MTTRDEIDAAIDQLIGAARAVGLTSDWDRLQDDPNAWAACDAAKARLLALISPARPDGDVTIVLSRKQAETASFAARYTASHLRHYPKDAELMNAITTVIEAAIAAAHDQPEDGQR